MRHLMGHGDVNHPEDAEQRTKGAVIVIIYEMSRFNMSLCVRCIVALTMTNFDSSSSDSLTTIAIATATSTTPNSSSSFVDRHD